MQESFGQYLKIPRPLVIHGEWFGETPQEHQTFVRELLASRKGQVTMFPAFSAIPSDGATLPLSEMETVSGEISRAAIEVLTAAARTLHPTHSWMVTGRSAPIHIPGNFYTPTPSGMGSPLQEVINVSGVELLVGVSLDRLTVIEAAEEMAKVPYGISPTPVIVTLVEQSGKTREYAFTLRDAVPVERDIEKLKALLIEEDALIEEAWGFVVHARVAFDRLCAKLRTEPNWLLG